jgi:hypothetical protein
MPRSHRRFRDAGSGAGANVNKESTMNKPLKRIRFVAAAAALSAGVLATGTAQASDSVLGAVIGGGAGAVIGQSLGGRDGAIIGGALGAAAGAAAASNHRHYGGGYAVGASVGYPASVYAPAPVYRVAPPVMYAPPPRVVYRPVYVAPRPVYYERPGWRRGHDRYEYRERRYGYRY